jgi:hypothetical protein
VKYRCCKIIYERNSLAEKGARDQLSNKMQRGAHEVVRVFQPIIGVYTVFNPRIQGFYELKTWRETALLARHGDFRDHWGFSFLELHSSS